MIYQMHLCDIFLTNGFKLRKKQSVIKKAITGKQTRNMQEEKKIIMLPYYGTVSSQIGRLTGKFGFWTPYRPLSKLKNWLCPVKDHLGLTTPGIYRIPCSSERFCIGQHGRTIVEFQKEHVCCIVEPTREIWFSRTLLNSSASTTLMPRLWSQRQRAFGID